LTGLETADAFARVARPAAGGDELSHEGKPLGAAPVVALIAAIGILLVALGDNAARTESAGAEPLFWIGLVSIYAPIAFRLLSTSASRLERIVLVSVLGVALFLVKVLYSPLGFAFYDELGWWRATHDLLVTGHPFSGNPLVLTTPGFPGLDLFTAPLSRLARLSIFDAGTIAVGFIRLAFVLALFLFFERATRSTRAAGIAVAVYACNPSFLYFNAQFAYESAALLIGMALLLVTVRWSESHDPGGAAGARGLIVAMALLAATLTVTHHMTAYAIFILLIAWAALAGLGDRPAAPVHRDPLLNTAALPAIMLGITASAWFVFVAGNVTVEELGDLIVGALRSVGDLVLGITGPKKPFEAAGQTNTWLARAVAVVSVLTLLAVIPLGLRKTWRASASDPLQRVLAAIAVLYVATLALRLTHNGTETSQRASVFVFLGLSFLAALVVNGLRRPREGPSRIRSTIALTILATAVFIGGFIVGEPPQGRQPGPFLISAERRSVSAQGLAAARFAGANLPPRSRILVDHANATLMASYGGLNPVMRRVNGIAITRVFFDRTLSRAARRVIVKGRIDYIVVDRRLSRTPPVGGYYFTREEPGSFERTNPIPASSLKKFAGTPGLTKIYGNGAVAIYDTYGLRSR